MWPDSFPDQCPPADATASSDTFFRIVADPISEQDFWGHRALIEAQLIPELRHAEDPCELEGVSVFDTAENAERIRKSNGRLRKLRVAAGSLSDSGVVKRTRTSAGHHTWWRPSEDVAWKNFEVLL